MSPEEWAYEERRRLCSAHQAMVDHDEKTSSGLAEINTHLKIIRWLAGAMFLAVLGSLGAVGAIIYHYGAIVQTVETTTNRVDKLENKFDRHSDRENWRRTQ